MDVTFLYNAFLKHPVVCTDTRKIIPGSVFFALKGENFNGNLFAPQALQQGCAYAVVDEDVNAPADKIIRVNRVLAALQQLAQHHRQQMPATVLALTGSNGKTTTKELLYAVLSQKFNCLATEGNLNNHIGVPLTLLRLTPEHQIAIIEMGANHQGEIDELCLIANPDLGLITNIGKAHLEGFGGEEGVLKGKTEMYRYLDSHHKKIFLNTDDSKLKEAAKNMECISYGTHEKNNTVGRIQTGQIKMRFEFTCGKSWNQVNTQLTGSYNFYNALAAVAVGNYFGISDSDITKGLEEYIPSNSRSQIETRGTNTLILDAYNANPSSMKLAIENASSLPYSNKLFLLGDMREMGAYAGDEHKKILEQLRSVNAQCVLIGTEFGKYKDEYPFHFFESSLPALEWLKINKPQNALILLKGSRGIKLETLLEAL